MDWRWEGSRGLARPGTLSEELLRGRQRHTVDAMNRIERYAPSLTTCERESHHGQQTVYRRTPRCLVRPCIVHNH